MNKTVANNIKDLREANGYTQDQVASFVGINRSTYSNYELGSREVPLETLELLADLYGCDLIDIYEENEDARKNMLATALRIDNVTPSDMQQIAKFKCIVKNYLKMNKLLES